MATRTVCVMGRVLDQMDGLGVYSATLLRHMIRKDPWSRYVILVRTDANASLFSHFPNAETRVMPSRSKTWWDQVLVPQTAWREGADVIFNPKFSIPLLSPTPAVFVLHGSDWYVNPRNYPWWDNLYIRAALPLYIRKAAKLMAISRTVADDMARHAHLDGRKVTVNYAAPGAHFAPMEDRTKLRDFAKRYRLPERFMLTVARVHHTGHDNACEYPGGNNENLIRGYRRYRAAGGMLPLVVVGRDIDQYLRAHGFDGADLEGVHFTGFIPNAEIAAAYNLADMFVLATLYESFCLPLVEAMACGCPALVPSTGACPEIGGEAARYVHPLDVDGIGRAMRAIAGSQTLRSRMSAAGLERALQFTWEATADRTLEALDSAALDNRSRKPFFPPLLTPPAHTNR